MLFKTLASIHKWLSCGILFDQISSKLKTCTWSLQAAMTAIFGMSNVTGQIITGFNISVLCRDKDNSAFSASFT